MKKIFLAFFLTLVITTSVSAFQQNVRLSVQAEPSYPSQTMIKMYKIEGTVLGPILAPFAYVVGTTQEFTKLSYSRVNRFIYPIKAEDKIVDKAILEKINSGDNLPIEVNIHLYAQPMKYERKFLESVSSDIDFSLGNGVNWVHATILPNDVFKITSLPSVWEIAIRSYPSASYYSY